MRRTLLDSHPTVELVEVELEVRERHFVPDEYVSLYEAVQTVHERLFGSTFVRPRHGLLSTVDPGQDDKQLSQLTERLYKSRNLLRQNLFSGKLTATILADSGEYFPFPCHVWGSTEFSRIMSTGVASFLSGAQAASGRVLINREQLDVILAGCTCTMCHPNPLEEQSGCAPDSADDLHRSFLPCIASARAETGVAEKLPPYLDFMVRTARSLGASHNNRLLKQRIVDCLEKNWPSELGSPSGAKLEYMATFLRHPEDEKGGHFLSYRRRRGPDPKTS